jgi:hypothetical protein
VAPKKQAGKTQQPYRQTRPDAAARDQLDDEPVQTRDVGSFSSDWPDDYEPMPNPLAGIQFTLDGDIFRCLGKLDLLDRSELSMLAMSSMDVRSPQAVGLVAQFLQLAFGPSEYLRFKAHIRANDTPDDTTLAILGAISELVSSDVEAETGRPTGPRSRSSAGQPAREERVSRVISLQGGTVEVVPDSDSRIAGGTG